MVIAILPIGLLATAAITQLKRIFGGGQENVAQIFVNETMELPLFKYRVDTGSYPTVTDGLEALYKQPSGKVGWKGPYGPSILGDPWQNDYRYRFPGQKNPDIYDLWSAGPNRMDFPLIEVVLVLVLIGIAGAIAITNFDVLSQHFGDKPVEVLLRKAVYEARYQAVLRGRPVYLSLSEEDILTIHPAIESEASATTDEAEDRSLAQFELEEENVTVQFFPIQSGSLQSIQPEPAKQPVGHIRFDPDRSSIPFMVKVERANKTS